MRKLYILSILVMLLSFNATSQTTYTASDIFTIDKITWFGLDFSQVRMIGPDGFTDPGLIFDTNIPYMNKVIPNEPEKYDLKNIFRKSEVESDLGVIGDRNEVENPKSFVLETADTYTIDESVVASIIAEYNPDESEGIGLVFVMESLIKADARGHMWVTFFDVSSKTVLLTEKMSGKAAGFGWPNYWLKSIHNVFKEIDKKKYISWEAQY